MKQDRLSLFYECPWFVDDLMEMNQEQQKGNSMEMITLHLRDYFYMSVCHSSLISSPVFMRWIRYIQHFKSLKLFVNQTQCLKLNMDFHIYIKNFLLLHFAH